MVSTKIISFTILSWIANSESHVVSGSNSLKSSVCGPNAACEHKEFRVAASSPFVAGGVTKDSVLLQVSRVSRLNVAKHDNLHNETMHLHDTVPICSNSLVQRRRRDESMCACRRRNGGEHLSPGWACQNDVIYATSSGNNDRQSSSRSDGSACLCVFDIDRTLTGRQDDVHVCPRNKVVHGIIDYAYGTGELTLSALAAEGINQTFCGACYLGIVSAGDAGGENSAERAYLRDTVLRSSLQDELRGRVPEASTWSHGNNVHSPLVWGKANRKKQDAVEEIRQWYAKQSINIAGEGVHFFGDRTENMDPFEWLNFHAEEISCASRDWGKTYIGYCGATPEEIVNRSGIHLCSDKTPTPTLEPTPAPTVQPTPAPTVQLTPATTVQLTPIPSTLQPTRSPTPVPNALQAAPTVHPSAAFPIGNTSPHSTHTDPEVNPAPTVAPTTGTLNPTPTLPADSISVPLPICQDTQDWTNGYSKCNYEECADDPSFRDVKNRPCNYWDSPIHSCKHTPWDYSWAEIEEVRKHCPASCHIECRYDIEDGCTSTGWSCAGYEKRGWCADGQQLGWTYAFGVYMNFPEKNCCACGGGSVGNCKPQNIQRRRRAATMCSCRRRSGRQELPDGWQCIDDVIVEE